MLSTMLPTAKLNLSILTYSIAHLMSQPTQIPKTNELSQFSTLELAQALMERLSISPNDWHRLKSNRKVRASEQAAAALVFLLKDNPEEALQKLQQASGWLDKSISAPPCPTHGGGIRD
ncbi:hypothetical protein NUACC26_070090 [Scytonema sp. NUACC26]